jgi:hypothetical protein
VFSVFCSKMGLYDIFDPSWGGVLEWVLKCRTVKM